MASSFCSSTWVRTSTWPAKTLFPAKLDAGAHELCVIEVPPIPGDLLQGRIDAQGESIEIAMIVAESDAPRPQGGASRQGRDLLEYVQKKRDAQ